MVDANSQGTSRIIKIITGEIKPAKHRTAVRYVHWRPDQWEDYNQLKSEAQKEAYCRAFGYPEEWYEEDEDYDVPDNLHASLA